MSVPTPQTMYKQKSLWNHSRTPSDKAATAFPMWLLASMKQEKNIAVGLPCLCKVYQRPRSKKALQNSANN